MESGAAGKILGRILGKVVTAILGLFLLIIIMLLGLLVVFFFNYNFFDLEALLYLGVGLLLLWSNIRRKPETAAESALDLAALPFQLIMVYGAVSMVLLSGLGRALPDSWEWPVEPWSSVIVFESGQKAVIIGDLWRIQVYDADGRFLSGWFLERPSNYSGYNMYKNDYGVPGEEETVLINQTLHDEVTVYGLDGRVVGKRKKDWDRLGFTDRKASDFPAVFAVGWPKWPLTSESNGLTCILIGLLGDFGLTWIRRFFKVDKNAPAMFTEFD